MHVRTVRPIVFRKVRAFLSCCDLSEDAYGCLAQVFQIILPLSQPKILNHLLCKSQINKNILAYNKILQANRKFLSSLVLLSMLCSPLPVASSHYRPTSIMCLHEEEREPLTICLPPAICQIKRSPSMAYLKRQEVWLSSRKLKGTRFSFPYSQNVQFMALELAPSTLAAMQVLYY